MGRNEASKEQICAVERAIRIEDGMNKKRMGKIGDYSFTKKRKGRVQVINTQLVNLQYVLLVDLPGQGGVLQSPVSSPDPLQSSPP